MQLNRDTGELTRLTRDETADLDGGLVRIGFLEDVAPYRWRDYVKMSEETAGWAAGLRSKGKHVGSNANDWRFSFDPVPLSVFRAVDRWTLEQPEWKHIQCESCPDDDEPCPN